MDLTDAPILSIPALGRNKLVLSNPSFYDQEIVEFTACLEVEGLQAIARIEDYIGGDLPEFFHDLAEHWQGWPGEKIWSSLDGVLQLACKSDRTGQHHLAVILDPFNKRSRPWSAKATIELEAGQLGQIAKSSQAFFAPHG